METLRIFAGGDLSLYLEQRRGGLRAEIQNEDKNKLLNVNEEDYVTYLVEKYRVDPLLIDFENVSVSSEEKMIPAEWFSARFNVEPGRRYPRQVITYHLPFSGTSELLRLKASTRLMWSRDVVSSSSSISFDVINWHDDAIRIKQEAEHDLKAIETQCGYMNADVKAFNESIGTTTRQLVLGRKQQHLKQSNLLAELGVPIRKAASVSETFAVPVIRKKVAIKPVASDAPFNPDPVLDESLYREILRICRDAGREMERCQMFMPERRKKRSAIILSWYCPLISRASLAKHLTKLGRPISLSATTRRTFSLPNVNTGMVQSHCTTRSIKF